MDRIATEERNQAHTRLALVALAGAFLLILPFTSFAIPGKSLHLAWVVFGLHLSYSLGVFYWLRAHPQSNRLRRVLSLLFDTGAISAAIDLLDGAGGLFYPIYLWVVAGYGMRFGQGFLILAGLLATLEFAAILHWNPYWAGQATLGPSLLAGLLILPAFYWVLVSRLHNANAALERRVAERTRELEVANSQLRRANQAKDEFLATMTHELRTPLTAILGMGQILREGIHGDLNPQQRESLDAIETSGKNLLGMIENILDMARVESGRLDPQPDPVPLDEACQRAMDAVRPQATTKKITLNCRIDTGPEANPVGQRPLQRILVNLLNNAVKFTPDGGQVEVRAWKASDERDLCIEVQDTGIGIAPGDLPRLFQPFVQLDAGRARHYEGSGLGLALVLRMARQLGGSVTVDSSPGKGSTFTLRLPCPSPAKSAPLPEAGSGRQILIVEDLPAQAEAMLLALEAQGHRVDLVLDDDQAVARCRSHPPDLVILDLQVSHGNGLKTIQRLRGLSQGAHAPIVALTALTVPGDPERYLAAGADACLSHPVGDDRLRETVNRLLTVPRRSAPAPASDGKSRHR